MNNGKKQNPMIRGIKKFFYSAFVAVTFILYALENRGTNALTNIPNTNGTAATPGGANTTGETSTNSVTASPTEAAAATNAPTSTATAAAAQANNSGYKDGSYTGPQVDIRWGLVQVQTTIQGGQITDVQFLQYPSERRTSARINSIANPELIQEAIQSQSANVNIITGATLTSEGFQESLQAALSQAKS